MPVLNDNVMDDGLNALIAGATRLDICDTEPATYTAATSTNSLGNKTGLTLTGPADGSPNGRAATIPQITDGNVTATGTAGYYALTDNAAVLWAAQALSATQAVTSGNTFTLASFAIRFPDPA